MIIWSGYGFFVPVIWFIALILTQHGIDSAMGEGTYSQNDWPKLVAGFASGAAIWVFGLLIKRESGSEKVLINKETGEEIVQKTTHSFFFIPFQYWAFVSVFLGSLFVIL